MKLKINYDILDKINIAKTGINVKYSLKNTGRVLAAYTPFNIGINLAQNSPEDIIPEYLFAIGLYSFIHFFPNIVLAKPQKEEAIKDLKILSSSLKALNVNTTQELLLDSEKYKTEYELTEEEKKIKQSKYISIPTEEDSEVSILQEHIKGTDEYTLSIGEPKKVYKLVPSRNSI